MWGQKEVVYINWYKNVWFQLSELRTKILHKQNQMFYLVGRLVLGIRGNVY